MDEFNNRIVAQRSVLEIVNGQYSRCEQLSGLSKKAIERWLSANKIDSKGEVAVILFKISNNMISLGIKSQEQVTNDYQNTVSSIQALAAQLGTALGQQIDSPSAGSRKEG